MKSHNVDEIEQRERELAEVPLPPLDKSTWPRGVRTIGMDELDYLGVDRVGTIYWNGKPIQTRKRISLRWVELTLAILVAVAAVVQAIAAVALLLKSSP